MPQPQLSSHPSSPALPAPTLDLLADMRLVARYLDHLADTALSEDAHIVARANAIRLWTAIDRVDELAHLVDDLAAVASASIRRES